MDGGLAYRDLSTPVTHIKRYLERRTNCGANWLHNMSKYSGPYEFVDGQDSWLGAYSRLNYVPPEFASPTGHLSNVNHLMIKACRCTPGECRCRKYLPQFPRGRVLPSVENSHRNLYRMNSLDNRGVVMNDIPITHIDIDIDILKSASGEQRRKLVSDRYNSQHRMSLVDRH